MQHRDTWSPSERVGLSEEVWSVTLGDSAFRGVTRWEEFSSEKEANIFARVIEFYSSDWDVVSVNRVEDPKHIELSKLGTIHSSALDAVMENYSVNLEEKVYRMGEFFDRFPSLRNWSNSLGVFK